LGDICKINGAEIEPVWCITGGSPCQDLSIAGKRAGLAGARSGLFMEQVRIVKEMREADKRNGRTGDMVRPRYLVWENVVGAFSSNKGKDFAAVLEEIIKIVEPEAPGIEVPEKGWTTWGGYHDEMGGRWSVVWRTHDAQYWGVPQRRRRISVVADFGGDTASEIQFDRESVSGDIAESREAGEGFAEAAEAGASYAVRIRGGCDGGGKGALVQTEKSGTLGTGNDQTIFCLQGNGIDRADTAECNGKGWREDVCYTLNTIDRPAVCAEVVCMTPWDAQSQRVYDGNGVSPTLSSRENSGLNREAVLCAGFKLGNSEQARSIGYAEEQASTLTAAYGGNKPAVMCLNDQGGNVMGVSHDVSGTLRAQEHGYQPSILDMSHACDVIRDCGEIVPRLQARMGTGGNQIPLTYQMQGFGDYREGDVASSCKQRDFKDSTDLVCSVDCRNFTEGGEINGTLQAKESGGQSMNLNNTVRQNMVVRRLTPLECERLQGFPDGWTDIGDWVKTDKRGREIKVKGSADSPRYKALGNSIALPFWGWMLRRMARYLPEDATLDSLFDGIGGFALCFERIHGKGTARWASEIEPFPIAVTKKWFGEE
jgi:DNA (cytosine-5)-methyltransferase 1